MALGSIPQQCPAPPGCPCTVGWPGGTKAEPDPAPPSVSPPSPPAPAYCCNALDGRWYSYDDSRVEGVREAEVSTRSAYILFYQRRNAAPAWAAGSSLRGEHPPPCPPAPHSTRKPRGRRPGHVWHSWVHICDTGCSKCAAEPQVCALSMCTCSVGVHTERRCRCTQCGVHTCRVLMHVHTEWCVHAHMHTDTHAHPCMDWLAHRCIHTCTCLPVHIGTHSVVHT